MSGKSERTFDLRHSVGQDARRQDVAARAVGHVHVRQRAVVLLGAVVRQHCASIRPTAAAAAAAATTAATTATTTATTTTRIKRRRRDRVRSRALGDTTGTTTTTTTFEPSRLWWKTKYRSTNQTEGIEGIE